MHILKSTEKQKILDQLNKQFGIKELPYLLIQFGEERLRVYSGSLSREELETLDKNIRIENAGIYAINLRNDEIRLTLDGTQLFKNQITKNILEVNDEQAEQWLKGNDIIIEAERGFKILKYNNEFIGCGKSTGEKISNFVPKERRIKS